MKDIYLQILCTNFFSSLERSDDVTFSEHEFH